jgi:hypothetical protein
MRHNDVYFGFALSPVEAELLYRELNAAINMMDDDDANRVALSSFRDRVLDFTRRHPCEYGN